MDIGVHTILYKGVGTAVGSLVDMHTCADA